MPNSNPTSAWNALMEGNRRFVEGKPLHPSQDVGRREELVASQHPTAVIFGCGDSRVAAEITFDQGLGDVFVVRTAGHVLDDSVLGSIEFATELLEVPLVVVLGHDNCGGLGATLDALDNGNIPSGFIRSIVERVAPSVLQGRREGLSTFDELLGKHVMETAHLLTERSQLIAQRVEEGKCAIVGLTYTLSDGHMELRGVIGDVGEQVA
ncbi:carbonic anhydrase [Tomitella gaofuii]|uniref:carbonic anhydrase n=1 Tax=Tomitella gaofuii TaxID=2760083 RepID=UPI0015FD67B5|nr:carbonic anhydrase [Tomitella gaofuii]